MEQKVIQPYHPFNHQGNWYVINVEGMFASSINAATAGAIERITSEPLAPLESSLEEQLKKLGLLSDGGGQTPKNTKASKKF